MRMSRHVGQRLGALRSIRQAMALPLPEGHTLDELRTEAVAALALPDIEVEGESPGGLTPGIVSLAFDGNLEKYARLAADGTVTLRRVSDDQENARWKEPTEGLWPFSERNPLFSRDGRYLSIWHAGSKRLVVRRLDGPEPIACYHAQNVSPELISHRTARNWPIPRPTAASRLWACHQARPATCPRPGRARAIRSLPMAAASQSMSIVTVNMWSRSVP